MRIVVTGSSGHLGEALVRVLVEDGQDVIGIDALASPFTNVVGSVADPLCVKRSLENADAVVHTATLHKPHIDSHGRQAFVDTNLSGTLTLLEESVTAGIGCFVFTSTTSTYGRALTPAVGAPAAWVTEDLEPVPRNVYGVTKLAAEGLCEIVSREHGLPCVILRTSRFFPEGDDRDDIRTAFDDLNVKVNELLYRRVDLQDVVDAHRLALARGPEIGFGRFVVSATTPFEAGDLSELRTDAPSVVRRYFPDYEAIYAERAWRMFPTIDRVYVNSRARSTLGWAPSYDFRHALEHVRAGQDPFSPLAETVGPKGYHAGG
jgi:UDP-glucose 4-epimerase